MVEDWEKYLGIMRKCKEFSRHVVKVVKSVTTS